MMFPRYLEILKALIIRDLMVRYGRKHLGFIWTVLEPMILCVGVMFVWSLIKEPFVHGVPLLSFVMTGYMPLTLWRHLTNPLVRILHNNANLFYHQPVTHINILMARLFLEFLSTTLALLTIYFMAAATDLIQPAEDLSLVLAGWLFTGWYFGAMGIMISAWTEYWEPADKFVTPLGYLQLPLSGTFFMVDWLPPYAQKLILLNPSVHCFEMIRAGMLGEAFTTHYNPSYVGACSAGMSLLALVAMVHVRRHIQTN